MISLNISNLSFNQTFKATNKVNILKETPNNMVLGYPVDSEGYFTDELNKKAGIPSDYKIHSDTIKSLVKSVTDTHIMTKTFKTIDVAKTISNAYKVLTQLVDENTLNSKDSFNDDDIAKMPQGYEYDKISLKVLKKHQSIEEYMSADASFRPTKREETNRTTTFYNPSTINFYTNKNKLKNSSVYDIFNNMYGGKEDKMMGYTFNTTREKYINQDGSTTKGGLLVGLLNQNHHIFEGETTYRGKVGGFDKNINSKDYQDMLNLWELNNDPNDLTDSQYNALSPELKDYVDFARSLKFVNTAPSDTSNKNEQEMKSPLELLFEQMNKDAKEMLKRLAKKAEQARIKKEPINEMMQFLNKISNELKIEIDIKHTRNLFLGVLDMQNFTPNLDIRA
ncbi:Cj0814 family flagellar-dependent secreted protein [Campylobacter gastrosuis]|uniref:DUF4885 domain-containing protein n=1 Tax=Campylobacter gastrosuis TaxID=2974576 RepID=A0ABT7HPI8_9BACT|nr:hypothetical protein [Campylobacter gastrosuis]MDL0088343.1 hypothetical protein [Campylobacter gastrosuis]